jgi:glucose 1-dehydrogenase
MPALALDFERRVPAWIDLPPPVEPAAGEVLVRIREVGVCGTDRELTRFSFGTPPPGERYLILGHEAVGQVVAAGPGVAGLARGDWVVPMVRRACRPACRCCAAGRRDLCLTDSYTERGITGAHGYFAGLVVDAAGDLVRVPPELAGVAVLTEPLSVVEKAIETGFRAHPDRPESALVLGAGAIGLLAALSLQAAGLPVGVCSHEGEDHPRALLLRKAGIPYTQSGARLPARAGLVLEATGSADAAALGLELLAPLGVLVILGAPSVPALSGYRLIVHNQTVTGIVNAAPTHFRRAVDALAGIRRPLLDALLERRPLHTALESLRPGFATSKLVHPLAE